MGAEGVASGESVWVTDVETEAPKELTESGFELGTVGLALPPVAPYGHPVYSQCSKQ